MKILYIAHERQAALDAARALRRIVPEARLTWASSPAAAPGWIRDNHDARAVIVDSGIPNPGCSGLLEQIRGLGLDTGVMVVALEHLQGLSAALDGNLARQQALGDAALARVTKVSTGLQERMLELEAALHRADQRLATERAATGQLTRREAELSAALADLVALRSVIEQKLADAEAARQHAVEHATAELAAADERCASVESRLDRESAQRAALEQRLAAAGAARADADQKHAGELASLTMSLAARDAQYGAALARVNRICTALQERLLELEAAMHTAGDRLATNLAEIDRLTLRETELQAAVEDGLAARAALGRQLSEVEIAHQRTAGDLTSATGRCADLEQQLNKHLTTSSIFEQRLAAAQAARHDAAHRHAAELGSLTTRVADVQARCDAATSQNAELERQLRDSTAALESSRRDRESEVAALTEQLARGEAEAGAELGESVAARRAVELRLSETERALRQALQDAATDSAAAAERYAALGHSLAQESAARLSIEARLAAAESASQEAARHHSSELGLLTTRLADVQAQHDAAANRSAALAERLRQEIGARTTLEARLAEADTARDSAARQHATELSSLGARLAEVEARHGDAVVQRAALEQQLAISAATLEQARRDWQADVTSAAERLTRRDLELTGALNAAAAARIAVETRLVDAEAAQRSLDQAAAAERAAAVERHSSLEDQLAARCRDLAGLQKEAAEVRRQLATMRIRVDALRRQAAQVPAVQLQLERSQKENRRQFERAPYGLYECGKDGVVSRVNHSLARLLGYRSSAELAGADFASTVFESVADLHWLLERAPQTGTVESVETTLKTRDLRRVSVRLHAHTREGAVVIAVEDLTRLHEVEHRLREAQRLEAVGRVASEVAATCDTLLSDVSQGGRRWLAAFESDTRIRQQGEQLLGDVTRAAGFLRQFVVYGHQQISNVGQVNLQSVLRDMAPVLKRVLGDDITLVLPKSTDRFEIDVDAERVERIFVNVANCARQRMPYGGRVKIQLETTFVDQLFLASHPRVRPGEHVLITVTEIRGAVWPALPVRRPLNRAMPREVPRPAAARPGIDLGPLLAIIGDAGGHLWMSVEPAGNVTLQIHLPKRTQQELMTPAERAAAADRGGRQLARWFRH